MGLALGLACLWEHVDGGDRVLKLPPSVVGDPDRLEAAVERANGVLAGGHTFKGHGPDVSPFGAEPLRVLPVELWLRGKYGSGGERQALPRK